MRELVGLPSTAPIIRALHYVTDASHFGVERGGRFESERMLSDAAAVAAAGGVLRSARVEKIVGALPEAPQQRPTPGHLVIGHSPFNQRVEDFPPGSVSWD